MAEEVSVKNWHEQSRESLDELNDFLVWFSDHVSTLESLGIPHMSERLLFTIALRCLPLSTRKAFEAVNTQVYSLASDVLHYVKKRVSLLEAVHFSNSSRGPAATLNQSKSYFLRREEKRSKITLFNLKLQSVSSSSAYSAPRIIYSVNVLHLRNYR